MRQASRYVHTLTRQNGRPTSHRSTLSVGTSLLTATGALTDGAYWRLCLLPDHAKARPDCQSNSELTLKRLIDARSRLVSLLPHEGSNAFTSSSKIIPDFRCVSWHLETPDRIAAVTHKHQ